MLFIGLSIIVYFIMASNCSTAFVKCPDCDYISKSTGGLAVHHQKYIILMPHTTSKLYILIASFLKGNRYTVVFAMS